MSQYLIFFNQQWVPDHPEEWFQERGALARNVVEEIKAAGAYVFAQGLHEEHADAFHAAEIDGAVQVVEGPYSHSDEFLGGFTVIDVEGDEEARAWAIKIAQACGWPQEVRRFKGKGAM